MNTRVWLSLCVLVLVLAACNTPASLPDAPTPIPTLVPATMPPPGAQKRAATGRRPAESRPGGPQTPGHLLAQKCASCHGDTGEGVVEGGATSRMSITCVGRREVDFYAVVTNGAGDMPAFKDDLSDEERWNATYYLWSFAVPASWPRARRFIRRPDA